MNIKVMNFEISCPIGVDWKEFSKTLRDVQYATWKTYNRTIQMSWDFQNITYGYKTRFGERLKFSDLGTGNKSQATDIYAISTSDYPYVSSSIISSSIRDAQSQFKALMKDILNGSVSIPSYKRDIPIPIRAQQMKIQREGSDYIIRFPLLSNSGARERGLPTSFAVKVIAKGSARTIFNRILSGDYKLSDSRILCKERVNKTKWFVSLAYKHDTDKPAGLSPDRVMGIDLGVVNAAVIAYNFTGDRFYFDGSEIRSFRARVEARRRQLQRQYKFAGSRRGHGRVTALKPIEKLRNKIANFRDTLNHRYSKKIVELAVKHGCGVIQMEDLSGIHADDRFLKSWPYHDLQKKIKYKAEEVGIEVRKIDPKYTSIRCSACGHIAEGNRKTQADFECVICGYKTNADYNAARNIATPGIEDIIKRKLDEIDTKMKLAEGS